MARAPLHLGGTPSQAENATRLTRDRPAVADPPSLKAAGSVTMPYLGRDRAIGTEQALSHALGAGLPTPPKLATAGLHWARETFGQAEWLGQETGHNAVCGTLTHTEYP